MTTKVFLADDHRLLVAGFQEVLKDYDINVVDVAWSLDGLIEKFLGSNADVLVVDVRFDSGGVSENGLDLCEALLKVCPDAKIIVFSQFSDQYIIERAYKIGVLSFVRKDESIEVLTEAIETVAQGKDYFSPEIARLLARSSVRDRNPSTLLVANELRVFVLTADGVSQDQIAKEMGLSSKTIYLLLKSIKSKLGIDTQADITKLAIRHGLTTTSTRTRI